MSSNSAEKDAKAVKSKPAVVSVVFYCHLHSHDHRMKTERAGHFLKTV